MSNNKLFRVIGFCFRCVFYIVYFPVLIVMKVLINVCKILMWFFRRKKTYEPAFDPEMFADASEEYQEHEPTPQKSISKIGTVVPVEEDHHLRSFTIMNAEGELFRIDTSAKGDFYGPVWTKILSCYESQETLRGRIIHATRENDNVKGFAVRIGEVSAYLSLSDSMRSHSQPPINTLLAVVHIDPEKVQATVSSRVAYARIFLNESSPCQGEKCRAIYWDYDAKYIYLLLPQNIMGIAEREETSPTKIEQIMGTLTMCNINSLNPQLREAKVTIIEEQSHMPQLSSLVENEQ